MLKGAGFDDDDLAKPLVGVCTTWIETMPCNLNQRALAVHVKRAIRETGGTPVEFNTIVVSDGVSMGSRGMRASLMRREVIADSIELVGARAFARRPGLSSSAATRRARRPAWRLCSLDLPDVVLYAGSIAPGDLLQARRDDPGGLRGRLARTQPGT